MRESVSLELAQTLGQDFRGDAVDELPQVAAATFAFRRVASLTAAAHGNPHPIQPARATVFHDGFAAGATFAVISPLISVILLPRIPKAGGPS